ncbi:MAG: antitoxin VbhA family protein [Advenella sp.]
MDVQSEEFRQEMKSEIGSLALEGLTPDAQALADLELVMQGKLTIEQAKQNVFDRIRNGKV